MSPSQSNTTVPIRELTLANEDFRRELITGHKSQVVLMSIPPGEEIGSEVHAEHDQVLVFVDGKGEAIIGGERTFVRPHDLTFVRAGVEHNFVNTGDRPLKLYTIYAPPEHEGGTVHSTKAEAEAAESEH